ncbi:fumarylacetoacetate hydrolase family protein [Rhodococcus koreensis]
MKLVSYATSEGPRGGVVVDGRVVDLELLLDDGAPVRDIRDLLTRDYDVLEVLRSKTAGAAGPAGAPSLSEVVLLPPILQPPSIRDHIAFEEHATRQFTRDIPDVWRRRPIHYYSNPSRVMGAEAEIPLPVTERLDFELEIAAVVADECSDLTEKDALSHIFGFTIMNDWSARDLQADEMAYGLGPAKGKDFATSLGPWVVTTDELLPFLSEGVLDLSCRVRVNGQLWAEGNSKAQYHSWGAMFAHASQDSRLLPGDVIASGTVGGCSIGESIRNGYPARYLVAGDQVELEVEAIGTLANTIVVNDRAPEAPVYRAHALPPMPVPLADTTPVSSRQQTDER